MADRVYRFRAAPEDSRPYFMQDIGHILQIGGILFQGEGQNILCVLHAADIPLKIDEIVKLTGAEWEAAIQASDNPQYYDQIQKVWLRKTQRYVSGFVQQTIWARDNFRCVYCGRKMGDVQLSVDHWIPLELGGEDKPSNYISACKACNKDKGKQQPEIFCRKRGIYFDEIDHYLKGMFPMDSMSHLIPG